VVGKAMISALEDGFVAIKGIDVAMEPSVTDLGTAITDGALQNLTPPTEDDLPGIVLGKDLAADIGAKVGEPVRLLTPNGTLSPMGVIPRQRRFTVVGIFRMGFYEVDAGWGFVDLDRGMLLAGTDRVDHIELKVADVYEAPRIADQIAVDFGPDYVTQDWTDINQQLYSALLLEKIGMGIGIGLIVAVAALNIVASLILLVMEKTRDIAILKTMGASSKSITLIFLLQGTIIGVIGTIIGAAGGAALAYFLDRYRVITIPSDIYQVSYLPFKLLPGDFAAVVIGAVLVCFLATLYPSRQAARLDPAQALRYE
jgi:lipoprotein-releasing system permease protein